MRSVLSADGHLRVRYRGEEDISRVTTNELPNASDLLQSYEAIGEAAFVTDMQGRVISLNPLAQKLVGPRVEVIGRVLHQLLGCVDLHVSATWPSCPIEHAVVSGTVVQLANHEFVCDGERFALTITCWPQYHGTECTGCLTVCRDLTANNFHLARDV